MIKLNIINNELVQTPFDENLPTIEVTNEQYGKIVDGVLKYRNGELVDITEEITKQNRIAELKKQLADTDYQAIKHSEGLITEEEYAPIKAQRQAWIDEINELEKEVI